MSLWSTVEMPVRGALSSSAPVAALPTPQKHTATQKTIENVSFACVGLNKCLNTTLMHLVYSLFKQGNTNWVIRCILHICVLPASVTTVRGGFSCYSCYWLMKGLELQCPLSPNLWHKHFGFYFQTFTFKPLLSYFWASSVHCVCHMLPVVTPFWHL